MSRHNVLWPRREKAAQRDEREALSRELADWLALADALRPSAPFERGCPLDTEALVIEGETVSLRNGHGNVVCPWVSCKYHLATELDARGNRTVNFPMEEALDQPFTCAIDVAQTHVDGADGDTVGRYVGTTRAMVSRVEIDAMNKLRRLAGQGAFRGL